MRQSTSVYSHAQGDFARAETAGGGGINISLVGFMGSGKSTVGHALSSSTSKEFVELDACIEQRAGMPISEIFRKQGEDVFRAVEKEELARALEGENQVIACGGGALLDEENRVRAQERSLVVHLDAPLNVLKERILKERSARPLARGNLKKLLNSRMPGYKIADLRVDATTSPKEVCDAVLAELAKARVCAVATSQQELLKAHSKGANLVEVRLDIAGVKKGVSMVKESRLPVIATNPNGEKGLLEAVAAGADFVDVPLNGDTELVGRVKAKGCRVICSHHDNKMPSIAMLKQRLKETSRIGDVSKIVPTAKKSKHNRRVFELLSFARKQKIPVVSFAMGEAGRLTRFLAPFRGSAFTFAHTGTPTAEGQPALTEFVRGNAR